VHRVRAVVLIAQPRDEIRSTTQAIASEQGQIRQGRGWGAPTSIVGPAHGDGGVVTVSEPDDQVRFGAPPDADDGDALAAEGMVRMRHRDPFRKFLV
jgi:hypothetical protein